MVEMVYRFFSPQMIPVMISKFKKLLAEDGMKARAVRGTLLTGFSTGAQNLIRLGGNLILTRLLFPEAFGLMAIVYVVLSAVRTFSDIGLTASVVQHEKGGDPLFLDTAWSLQIIRGLLLSIVIWLLAAPIAGFYEQPELAAILPVIGLSTFIQGFNSMQIATARRDLLLGRLTFLELAKQVLGLMATILLVMYFRSVWALVYGFLFGTVVLAVLSHLVLPGRKSRLGFHWPYARGMLQFGAFIFLSSAGAFFLTQGDRIILGKITSMEELGIYTIAFFLATVPILLAQALSNKIVFPLYARRSPWKSEANRRNVFKARRLITGITFAGLIFFALVGQALAEFLYDPRYHSAGQMIALLAIAHMPIAIVADHREVALAAGHSGKYALISLTLAAAQMGTMMLFGSWFGLNGVIVGIAVAPLLIYPALIWLVRPYKGWDKLHDFGFALLALAFALVEYQLGAFDFMTSNSVF